MEEYFEIGQIVNTSGLKGLIKIKPFTDDITRFNELKTIYITIEKKLKEFNIQDVKQNKNMVLLKLEGIDTIEEAEKYRNLYISIPRDRNQKLEKDTYFVIDIIGCDVYTEQGQSLGKIVDVFSTGSNDVYIVQDELGKQVLLPATKEVIKEVDIENKKIIIHLLEGLI